MSANRDENREACKRKKEQLDISLHEDVSSQGVTTGFERYYFLHQALPEIRLEDIDLSTTLLGKELRAPLLISPMVGGIPAASRLNRNLAAAAQKLGLAMGLGSQRPLKDSRELLGTYEIRDAAPDILLFANLGAVQLNYGWGASECLDIVRAIGADALTLHLNPLQEAIQPEGNTDFSGLLEKISRLCRELPVPVVVKEVGCGISEETAARLARAGAAAIDIAGAGGTCWSEIERRRTSGRLADRTAAQFSSWGIPTADSLQMARKAAPELPIIASGGIRSGLDAAKAIALGADAAALATPLLRAADISSEEVEMVLREILEVLRIAMFCTGTPDIQRLKNTASLKKFGEV